MQDEKRYPVAFRPRVSGRAWRAGARCAVEKVDGERYYFKSRPAAERFMKMHGLEPVTDTTLGRIRAEHPNAVVVGPLGSGSGTIVWDVDGDVVQVYPAVKAIYSGRPSGRAKEIGLAWQNLEVGKVYTVSRVSIGRGSTHVELAEKPGLRFGEGELEYVLEQ